MNDAAQLTLVERLERSFTPGVVLLLLLACGATLLASELLQGWYAYDEGALGQSAERVLRGDIPHRDFDEIYTGLLTYLNAAIFAVSGPGMVPMRIALFGASMAWLWATYRIALRFAPAAGAGLVALIAFTWAVPNYTAAMPSWYILFATTFGALALVRWHETGRDSWLVLAGAAGGVAFLFKLSGIFYFLGAGMALLAAGVPSGKSGVSGVISSRSGLLDWGIAAALAAMVIALGLVAGGGDREFLRHVLPTTVLAAAIAAYAVRGGARTTTTGMTLFRHRLLPFALGGVLPIAVFFAFYAAVGGLQPMLEGVFVTPFRRLSFAALRPPPVASLVFAVPLMLYLWVPSDRGARKWLVTAIAALSFGAVFALSARDSRYYQVGWLSAWGLLFFVAIDGARQVLASRAGKSDARFDTSVSLACVAVGLSLIEYPYAAPIYTLYALPLAMVAAFAALRTRGRSSMAFQLVLAAFFLVFGLFRIVPGTVSSLGRLYAPSQEIARLELDRGGVRIEPYAAVVYERLIPLVQELAVGRRLWAGPDAPEIYFLSGLPNHTRSLFDFLDVGSTNTVSLIQKLDSLNISLVVLKLQPPFSGAPTVAMREALQDRFPQFQALPGFVLFWR